jgi:DNA-binding NarL/FixJ family response regulator
VRDALRLSSESLPGVEVIGEASSAEEAVAGCRELQPDVLVLDRELPDLDGLEVVRRLTRRRIPLRIVLFSRRADPRALFEARRAGAHGFLSRRSLLADLPAALATVAAGGLSFTAAQERSALAELRNHLHQAREGYRWESLLTRRERQILALMAGGLTDRQIASRLGRSERTVQAHLSRLYAKLGARSRVAAVAKAASLGLLDLRSPAPREADQQPAGQGGDID